MISGPILPPGVGPVAVAVIAACVTTRWAAPLAIRILAKLAQGSVAILAAIMILPEYYITASRRRHHRDLPQLAYNYSATVGSTARLTNQILGFCMHHLAKALRAIPPAVVGVIAALLTIAWLLGLLPV
jgi:hypothetical protein